MPESKAEKTGGGNAPSGVTPPVIPDDSPGYALAERAVWHLLEKKAEDATILDLRGRSDVCDFYVLVSGRSDQQVTALAKHLYDVLLSAGHKPKGVEGMTEGRWALLDLFDVVVHVFRSEARAYFNLEHLWGDAPRMDVAPSHFAKEEVAARHPDLNFTLAPETEPGA